MNKQQKIKINLNNLYKLINNNLTINLVKTSVGDIIYIDNFFKKPYIFYEGCINNIHLFKSPKGGYPGISYNIHEILSKEFDKFILHFINPLLYGNNNKNNKIFNSVYNYAIVTHLNKELNIGNMIPHTDCRKFDENFKFTGIANVIYLFNKNNMYNGTCFYKPLEKITGHLLKKDGFNNSPHLIKKVNYLKKIFKNKCYNADDDKSVLYNKVFSIDAKYNRAVFYKTSIHHNADINKNYFYEKILIKKKNLRCTIASKLYFINKVELDYYDMDKTFVKKYDKDSPLYISYEKINLLNKYLKKYNKNVMIKVPDVYF